MKNTNIQDKSAPYRTCSLERVEAPVKVKKGEPKCGSISTGRDLRGGK